MYLGQSIEERRGGDVWGRLYCIVLWRVELNAGGRPVWKLHGRGTKYNHRDSALWHRQKHLPLIPTAAHDKPVTKGEAVKLTGLDHPMAALDYLTEHVDGSTTLQNWVKPPKVKEPKPVPTPVEIARSKRDRAEERVAELDRKIKRLETLRTKWTRKATAQKVRVQKLEDAK